METSPAPLAWKPARVARREPRLARVLARLAAGLVLVPLALAVLVGAAGPGAPGWLAAAAVWARLGYAGAAVLLAAAFVMARGVMRPGAVALEARSFFIAVGSRQRRLPRGIVEVALAPRAPGAVDVWSTRGDVYRIEMEDEARAEWLVAALGKRPKPGSRLPAPARAT